MEHVELIIFGLLLATAGLAVLAGLVRVPYPVTLVIGGAAIGFLPGVPDVELEPDLVLLIFLPPLLYGAAFFTSVRDLRRNAGSIAMLSIPLVLVTSKGTDSDVFWGKKQGADDHVAKPFSPDVLMGIIKRYAR